MVGIMTRFNRSQWFSLIFIVLSLLIFAFIHFWKAELVPRGREIHIAVAVDKPEPNGLGNTIVRAAKLFADELNQGGGVDGAKLVVDVYDDGGRPDSARQTAETLTRQGRAVAVIGHRLSSQSLAAGPIYQREKIPAITPASTATAVTSDNMWFFRTIYHNDFIGRFLAHYIKVVIAPEKTLVVHGPSDFETKLARVFMKTARELDMPVDGPFLMPAGGGAASVDELMRNLKDGTGRRALFMALYTDAAFQMVKAVRELDIDVKLVAPHTIAHPNFPKMFSQLPLEISIPGYYTDGVTMETPLVFDTANRQAGVFRNKYISLYGESPDWRAAFTYDAVGAAIEAIRRGRLVSRGLSVAEIRAGIRRELAAMNNLANAYEGITGLNYFDEKGDAAKPAAVAQYQGGMLISALSQFQTLKNLPGRVSLASLKQNPNIINISGQLMERTKVIYTGLTIDDISDIDPGKMTAGIKGKIWFRYEEDKFSNGQRGADTAVKPHNIVFTNALGPVEYEAVTPVKDTFDSLYQRFGFKGTFRLDFIPAIRQYRQPTMGLEFRHADLPAGRLLYVTDMIGMGLDDDTSFQDTISALSPSLDADGWRIVRGSVYQGTQWISAQGQPEYLNADEGLTPYSTLVAALVVKSTELDITDLLPAEYHRLILYTAFALFLATLVVHVIRAAWGTSALITFLQFVSVCILLMIGGKCLLAALADDLTFQQLDVAAKILSTAWWLVPAYYLSVTMERFIWHPLEIRAQRPIPNIVRRSAFSVIFLLALFGVVAFVLDQPLTSLLATSGLITLIIGLAVQANISNIFSGLVLNVERPFVIGDIVKIGDLPPSKVIDITWRATRLINYQNYVYNVPNTQAAESTIQNFSKHEPVQDYFSVYIPPSHDPEKICRLITEAIKSCQAVIRIMPVETKFIGEKLLENSVIMEYWPMYYLEDYHRRVEVRDEVWRSIWQHLTAEGINVN